MVTYANYGGDSNVEAYQIDRDCILVKFKGAGACHYLYTYRSCGQANIERMKGLAQQGEGLNSFIMRYVKNDYESKY